MIRRWAGRGGVQEAIDISGGEAPTDCWSRVVGFGYWVSSVWLLVSGFGSRVSDFMFQVSGFEFHVSSFGFRGFFEMGGKTG